MFETEVLNNHEVIARLNNKGESFVLVGKRKMKFLGLMDTPNFILSALDLPKEAKICGFEDPSDDLPKEKYAVGFGVFGENREEVAKHQGKLPDVSSWGSTQQETYNRFQQNVLVYVMASKNAESNPLSVN